MEGCEIETRGIADEDRAFRMLFTTYFARANSVLLLSIAGASNLLAQVLELTPQTASAQLSGSRARAWILRDVVGIMGSGRICSGSGELYTFAADQSVTIERC